MLNAEPTWWESKPSLRFLAPLIGRKSEPQIAAIRSLEAAQLPEAAKVLGEVLADREFPYRLAAMRSLARIANPDSLKQLIGLLDDPDEEVRSLAARLIGSVGLKKFFTYVPIEPIVARLGESLSNDPSPAVRIAAIDSLLMLGTTEGLIKAFETAIRDEDALVNCSVLAVSVNLAKHYGSLKLMGPARASAPTRVDAAGIPITMGDYARARRRAETDDFLHFQSQCRDPNLEALRRLAEVRAPEIYPVLLRSMASADAGLRAVAVSGLAHYKRPEVFQQLSEAVDDPVRGVREAAIAALALMKTPGGDRRLAAALTGSDGFARQGERDRVQIANALVRPWEGAALVSALGGGAVQVRRAAEHSLLARDKKLAEVVLELGDLESRGVVGAERARITRKLKMWESSQLEAEQALLDALGSESDVLRARAGAILASFQSVSSKLGLLHVLRAGGPLHRDSAARVLGVRGGTDVVPELAAATHGDSAPAALSAVRALQDIGSREALFALRDLSREGPIANADAEVREAIVYATQMLEARYAIRADEGLRHD